MRRLAAAAIALIAWAGLAVQFNATLANNGSALATSWILLRFFTVITNLLVALAMTAIAAGRRVPAFWLGGVTLAILLVGAVYFTLLRGLIELSGGALLADFLLHKAVPLLMAFYWLLFASHGELRWTDCLRWALYPVAYFSYALVRGAIEGRYPYPFIDVGSIGVPQTLINAMLIAAAFVAAGFGLIGLDRVLPRGRSKLLATAQGNK